MLSTQPMAKPDRPTRGWDVLAHIHAIGFEAIEIRRTGDRMAMVAEVADDYPGLAIE
jgi:hypothetical protein